MDKMNWISVKDRLPKLDCKGHPRYVLVHAGREGVHIADCYMPGTLTYISKREPLRYFYFGNNFRSNIESADPVTHWMPLPDAPKEYIMEWKNYTYNEPPHGKYILTLRIKRDYFNDKYDQKDNSKIELFMSIDKFNQVTRSFGHDNELYSPVILWCEIPHYSEQLVERVEGILGSTRFPKE